MKSTLNLEDSYLALFKDCVSCMDGVVQNDIEFIGQYLVLRFIQTSPAVIEFGHGSVQTIEALKEYIKTVYPFMVAFIMSANFLDTEELKA